MPLRQVCYLERKLVHRVNLAEVVDDEEEKRRSLRCGAVKFSSLVDLCLVLSGFHHLCVPIAQNELLGRPGMPQITLITNCIARVIALAVQ